MRLQVSLHRHTLPPVNIIFASGTGPSSHTSNGSATIFNLLEDLNEIVPLESSDGEWGLEDYVVEVAATVDQEKSYECLHYLQLKSVLREDDEIVVRPLGSDDLRLWRRGGRMQITADGRHLIDGVVFSKQWLRKDDSRPGVAIPPRKRRRLLYDGEDSQKENQEPLQPLLPALDTTHESDSETDDNYAEEEDEDRAITLKEIFEDADTSENELSDVDDQEIQLLLEDAAELDGAEDVEDVLEEQLHAKTRLGKRKRRQSEDTSDRDDQPFEGFESPVRTRVLQDVSHQFKSVEGGEASEADSMLEEIVQRQLLKQQANLLDGDDDQSTDEDFSSSESSSSESSIESPRISIEQLSAETQETLDEDAESQTTDSLMADLTEKDLAKSRANELAGDEEEDGFDDSSSSESSLDSLDGTGPQKHAKPLDAYSKRDSLRSGTSSSSSSSSSEASESSESSSSSGSDSDSSSNSEASSKAQMLQEQPPCDTVSRSGTSSLMNTERNVTGTTPNQSQQSPPGSGLGRTRHNNKRVKRRVRLSRMKSEGLLPADANFKDLAAHDGVTPATASDAFSSQHELEAARERALARLSAEPGEGTQTDPTTVAGSMSMQPEQSYEQPQSTQSPMIPETQEDEIEAENASPTDIPSLSQDVLDRVLSLDDRGKAACEWLRASFENAADGSVTQDALFVAYHRCFSGHNPLPGSALLLRVREVFSDAVVIDPFDPYTAIRGIRPRVTTNGAAKPSVSATSIASNQATSPIMPPKTSTGKEPSKTLATPEPASSKTPPTRGTDNKAAGAFQRLIFGALGVRTPTTPEQKKAVQDKLAGSARRPAQKATLPRKYPEDPVEDPVEDPTEETDWQRKLVISAVECESDAVYPPPPFPFVQFWHDPRKSQSYGKPNSSSMRRVRSQETSVSSTFTKPAPVDTPRPISKTGDSQPSVIESRTVSFERGTRDGMPIPSDFSALAELQKHHALPGAIIALKLMEFDHDAYEPVISAYKVARINAVHDDRVEFTLAERYRQAITQNEEESEQTASKYNQFVVESDTGEDDGVRTKSFEELVAPKLIERSAIQVADSHGIGAPLASHTVDEQPAEGPAIISESVGPTASIPSASLQKSAEPLAVSSPRRHEISAMMKEDGFESGIGEYLLHPNITTQDSPCLETGSHAGLQDDDASMYDESIAPKHGVKSSSPLFPPQDDAGLDDPETANYTSSEAVLPLSSPPISSQLTVNYPSIPHIDLYSDAPDQTRSGANESSHSNAQRVSPLLEADTTLIASEQRDKLRPIEDENDHDVGTNVSGSDQPEDVESSAMRSEDGSEYEASSLQASFLGPHLRDGPDFSFHDESASDSSDSTPSYRDLSSSQKRKIMTRASRVTKKSPPLATRRSLRNSSGTKTSNLKQTIPNEDGASDDYDLPSQTAPVKVESSQVNGRNSKLGRIPPNTQVVDLTLSSDPMSPAISDGEFELPAKTNGVSANGGVKIKKTSRDMAADSDSDASFGIGKRMFLTSKKRNRN